MQLVPRLVDCGIRVVSGQDSEIEDEVECEVHMSSVVCFVAMTAVSVCFSSCGFLLFNSIIILAVFVVIISAH